MSSGPNWPPATGGGLDELATRLARLAPSCGPVRLVGVDGHAGSGKSTLAARLSALTGGAPVLHLDDVASHDELFSWLPRLTEQVLDPLSEGREARYEVYDWSNRTASGTRPLPPAPLILVEGVGAGRRALRPHLAAVLWSELPRKTAWERGRHRDGPELADFWQIWMAAEEAHFHSDPTRPHAHWLVRQSPEGRVGFRVFPGPAGHPRQQVAPDAP
ncbi:uridine kinase family protein [Streptomyces alkaliterrae]|uniref:Uridine kinase n=1 Tax=Streptomyces alkaliterrae TaxID=2213162 RepID=A0A5P0YUE5_9ACTN|nr:hypothetical protein [Streptomyces alkaliterrae]MBB1255214.1 hypothetical protein [Streptomyces alkaliterrae]MBB1258921.1 hypothetical protein [Streptomyces alkaliterrae]MQS03934.1 hypothetical protein [Streptomyces alkaliterrae]